MAVKEVWVGSQGPFLFDDGDKYPGEPAGPNISGLRTDTVIEVQNVQTTNLTSNVRLVVSDSNKEIQEVNDLTQWIAAGLGIAVEDGGAGTVTIKINHDRVVIDDTDSPYSITIEYIIIVDASAGDVILNLPAIASAIQVEHIIKRSDDTPANDVTINTNASETIEGATSYSLPNKYDYVELYPGPSEWLIVGGT